MESKTSGYPLVVTLELDEESKAYFNALRKNHFPNHANYLDAHLTLFHHLPSNAPFIMDALRDLAQRSRFKISVSHLINFEKGVAFHLESQVLEEMHVGLQEVLEPFLKKHDKKKLWPHITIQNKVTAFKAQQTLELLQQDFVPFEAIATGINVWYYIGGPWKLNTAIPFQV